MKDLPVTRGRRYIANLVAQGEHANQDFKFSISDPRKIARSISAFANADGGRLLIGVKDNGAIAGVRNEEDIYVVEQAAQRYCDPPQDIEFAAYSIENSVVVIQATIAKADIRPVFVLEADGSRRAYFRVADENIVAHPLMVRAWQFDRPLTLALGSEASRLLELVDSRPDGLEQREIAIALHLSQRAADELVTSLISAGILGFRYVAPRFRIVRQTE